MTHNTKVDGSTTSIDDKSECRWKEIGEQAVKNVEMYMREMLKHPGEGTITVELMRCQGKITVTPAPDFRFRV
jgi:hypothetical protein